MVISLSWGEIHFPRAAWTIKNYFHAPRRQDRTCTDGLKFVRSSESAPILILGDSPVSCFRLFSVLKKNGFPAPCPTHSPHLSCSREKERSERESSGADAGAVNEMVTGILCAEIGVQFSMSTSSQSENKCMKTVPRAYPCPEALFKRKTGAVGRATSHATATAMGAQCTR